MMRKNSGFFRITYLFLIIFAAACLFSGCDSSSSSSGDDKAANGGENDNGDDTPPELDDYLPGTPAPLTATLDSVMASSGGEAIHVGLDDGTDVYVPDLKEAYDVVLERDSVGADLKDLIASLPRRGQVSLDMTGSLRRLVVTGSGDPSDLKPVVTIPASEAGTVNLETVNVLRVGDVLVDGELVENHVMFLPAYVDDNGGLRFIDPLMPDGVVAIDHPAGAPVLAQPPLLGRPAQSAPSDQSAWVGNTRYLLMTFENDLNWQQDPQLVRMVPDSSAPGYRRPATQSEIREMAESPVCNVVILVHGHNDYEQAGFEDDTEMAPWRVNYKRLVWDLMYQTLDAAEDHGAEYPLECTAFYEFIYPTYRPIFSPVLDKTGWPHETLGEAMGRLVDREIKDNPQFKAMIDNDMPFNLLVASHSMGGLVARAGFRHMPEAFVKNLQGFVSWGSPHRGAALYSFRYVLEAGHDLVWQGVRFPLQNIGTSEAYQNVVDSRALDTPSKRDMRWDAANKNMLRLGDTDLFAENVNSIMADRSLELPDGEAFFSRNMTSFSESEGDFMGGLLDDKYILFHGTTSKRAEAEKDSGWFPWSSTLWRFMDSTPIEKGAFLNWLLMKEGYKDNDGAVPLYSQKAGDLNFEVSGIRYIDMGDTDHEEFYGAEHPQRSSETIEIGNWVARNTYGYMELNTNTSDGKSRNCPSLEAIMHEENDKFSISGMLDYPPLDAARDSEGPGPGDMIKKLEVRDGDQYGPVAGNFSFSVQSDGNFSGSSSAGNFNADTAVLVAVLHDDSEVFYDGLQSGEPFVNKVSGFQWQYPDGPDVADARLTAEVYSNDRVVISESGLYNPGQGMTVQRGFDSTLRISGVLEPDDADDWLTFRSWDTQRTVIVDKLIDGEWQPRPHIVGYQGSINRCSYYLSQQDEIGGDYYQVADYGDTKKIDISPDVSLLSQGYIGLRYHGECIGRETVYPEYSAYSDHDPYTRDVTIQLPVVTIVAVEILR